jgi:peroxiredoxin
VPPAVALETQARYRSRERIAVGDLAPDFDLERLDAGQQSAGRDRVRLSSFRGQRPVVLFFGSYT